MILDPTKIKQEINGQNITFSYPLQFDGADTTAILKVNGYYPNRSVEVILQNANGERIETHLFTSEEDGSEVQKSWEKFEDFFNQSDEGEKQKQDEVENLFTSFDLKGNAVLFLQNLKGEQKSVLKYQISDATFLNDLPMAYQMDMSNNQQLPQPLQVKWLMANVSDSVKSQEYPNYANTYQVAILGIPPTQPPPPSDEENDEMIFFRLIRTMSNMAFLKQYSLNKKTKEENYVGDEMLRILNNSEPYKVETPMGEGTLVPYPSLDSQGFKAYVIAIKGDGGGGGGGTPTDEHGQPKDEHGKPKDEHGQPKDEHGQPKDEHGKPKDEHGKPKDEHGKPKDEEDKQEKNKASKKYNSSEFTSKVAEFIGREPNQIARSMRNVDSFRDLLDNYNVKVNDIAFALNLPTNNTEFFKEVKKIIEQ